MKCKEFHARTCPQCTPIEITAVGDRGRAYICGTPDCAKVKNCQTVFKVKE